MFDLIGKTVGSYRILEQIGAGGMATVYKAYQPNMDRYIAVKILPVQLSKDPEFVKRFQREARAIARLEHSHILPVFDYGEYEGITYIAMRYIKAGTLKDRMSAGRLPLEEINRLISQIGGALDYAHRMGVIHRDIKPANVLIDDQGDVYLSDFGLARMMEPTQQITGTGVGLGTPAYMSPEQGQGIKVDHRSDIYSLGILLYEMLTGRVPYEAETPMAVVFKHINGDLPLPHTINPNTPEPVERVILKALAKDPDDRYQTVGEMVQALNFAVRMMSAGAEKKTIADKIAPAQQDVSLVTKIQRLWDRPRGRLLLTSGTLAVIMLLGFLLLQLPGNVSILASGAPTSTMLVSSQPTTQPTATSPSNDPVVTDSTAIPTPLVINPDTQVLLDIAVNSSDGTKWCAKTAGNYSVEYQSGVYSVMENHPACGGTSGWDCWTTWTKIYKNREIDWGPNGGDFFPLNPDFELGWDSWQIKKEDAETLARAGSNRFETVLNKDECLTFVVNNGKTGYAYIRGTVEVLINKIDGIVNSLATSTPLGTDSSQFSSPIQDVRIRQAIAFCTDRHALAQAAYPTLTSSQIDELMMDSFLPKTHWAYSKPTTQYPFDVVAGSALLDQAGWLLPNGKSYRTNNQGEELSIKLTTTVAQLRQNWAAAFESQMRDCGIRIIRIHVEGNWFFGDNTGVARRDFELGAWFWPIEENPDVSSFYDCDSIPSLENGWQGQNAMGWCNLTASEAAKKAADISLSQAERKNYFAILQDEFAKDMPSLPLFIRDDMTSWEHIDFNLSK